MAHFTIDSAFQAATRHHQAGQLPQAEALYRQILAEQPNHAHALHLLGVVAHQVGRNDIALDFIRQAIALAPTLAQAHSNLGEVLKALGQPEEAIPAYRRAIALKPNFPDAHNNLGNALAANGQLDEAIAAYREAITLKPDYCEAHGNLGNVLSAKGQFPEALTAYRRAAALQPTRPEIHYHLGNALQTKGQLDEAVASYRQAIALRPNYPEAHNNLGSALKVLGQLDGALASLREAIALRPNFPEACNNLGDALKESGQLDAAVDACRQAIAFRPNFAEAYGTLGNVLKDMGMLDEAIAAYRQAIALKPNLAIAHSNLVYTLHFHPGCTARDIAEEASRWNRQHAEPLRNLIRLHANDRDPGRRLRVGYVSPDFSEHVVGRALFSLLASHDRQRFEIFAYAEVPVPDDFTGRLRAHVDHWRNIVGLSDEEADQVVRDDRIDILVDLTLHMAHNRLLIFARKPAPVQVTWLGYPSTTGMRTMDYRLSDRSMDPPGLNDPSYSEQTVYLSDTFQCYNPLNEDVPVGPLPASERGYVAFGCLNNFCKINDAVLELWSQILNRVTNSHLLLLTHRGSHQQRIRDFLANRGIAPERVEFPAKPPTHREYLQLYQTMDIGLDPFPYNGHTTSMDSVWMGVPVVSLHGLTAVSRAGLSQCSNLSLMELVTADREDYVRIAVELANDLPKLIELRATLRQRMKQSPLMDTARFARNVETAYRTMWQIWCSPTSVNI